jgi:hypothetical protein
MRTNGAQWPRFHVVHTGGLTPAVASKFFLTGLVVETTLDMTQRDRVAGAVVRIDNVVWSRL